VNVPSLDQINANRQQILTQVRTLRDHDEVWSDLLFFCFSILRPTFFSTFVSMLIFIFLEWNWLLFNKNCFTSVNTSFRVPKYHQCFDYAGFFLYSFLFIMQAREHTAELKFN
jgi:hypothetical protein